LYIAGHGLHIEVPLHENDEVSIPIDTVGFKPLFLIEKKEPLVAAYTVVNEDA